MFDVGFSEILMVALVALLVLGPEKLPKAARIAGFWLGKSRSMIAHVKEEIKHELQAEEIRQLVQKQIDEQTLQQTVNDSDQAIKDFDAALDPLTENKTASHHDKSA
jgi:sec-independent protein translocase protein TatB